MKLRRLLLVTTSAALLVACDRNSGEAQRLAEERAALEKEKAQLATDRAVAERAATEQERAKLESERAALEVEKARLAGDKDAQTKAEHDAKLAAERAQRLAAERRAADAEVREREARAAAQTAATQAHEEQSVDFFYTALDPYGDWVQVEGRGYCWRPHVARGWQPYTDGGWVSTDYGWTWRSNEPFGWAVYHYGRWTRAPRLGWIWVPGTEWGPAWVSWRRSDEYVGWAPLPPDAYSASGFTASVDSYFDIGPGLYAFLRIADFGEPTYVGRVVAPEQNVTIIRQTTNVTNVTYQTVQNRVTIVNRGPDVTVINQHSRQPVQHLAVERVAAGAPAAAKPGTLRLVAPTLNAKPAIAKPKQVKEQVKAAELEHGWADAKGEAPKIREHAAQEARQAEEEQRKGGVGAPLVTPQKPPVAQPAFTPPARPTLVPKTESLTRPAPPQPTPTPKIEAPARPTPTQPEPPRATPVAPQKRPTAKAPITPLSRPPVMPNTERPARVVTPPPAVPQVPPIEPTRPQPSVPQAPERPRVQRPEVAKPMPAKPGPPLKQFQKPTPEPATPNADPREKKKRE